MRTRYPNVIVEEFEEPPTTETTADEPMIKEKEAHVVLPLDYC